MPNTAVNDQQDFLLLNTEQQYDAQHQYVEGDRSRNHHVRVSSRHHSHCDDKSHSSSRHSSCAHRQVFLFVVI